MLSEPRNLVLYCHSMSLDMATDSRLSESDSGLALKVTICACSYKLSSLHVAEKFGGRRRPVSVLRCKDLTIVWTCFASLRRAVQNTGSHTQTILSAKTRNVQVSSRACAEAATVLSEGLFPLVFAKYSTLARTQRVPYVRRMPHLILVNVVKSHPY